MPKLPQKDKFLLPCVRTPLPVREKHHGVRITRRTPAVWSRAPLASPSSSVVPPHRHPRQSSLRLHGSTCLYLQPLHWLKQQVCSSSRPRVPCPQCPSQSRDRKGLLGLSSNLWGLVIVSPWLLYWLADAPSWIGATELHAPICLGSHPQDKYFLALSDFAVTENLPTRKIRKRPSHLEDYLFFMLSRESHCLLSIGHFG